MEEIQYPPLNLGDPESGYLTEANLLSISLQIGQDWRVIGLNLGLNYTELDRIQYKYRYDKHVMFRQNCLTESSNIVNSQIVIFFNKHKLVL